MNFEYIVLKELIRPVKKLATKKEYYNCLFAWCRNIYEERDRLNDILSNGIRQLDDEPDEQLLYMNGNIRMLEDLKRNIPISQEEFERRFITDNIDLLIRLLEAEREERNPAYLIRI